MVELFPTVARTILERLLRDPLLLVVVWYLTGLSDPFVDSLARLAMGTWRIDYSRLSVHGERVSRFLSFVTPSRLVHRLWPEAEWTRPSPTADERFTAWIQGPRELTLFIFDSTAEEFVYRGMPLAAATFVGVDPTIPILASTAIWTVLHYPRQWTSTALKGLLLSGLWLVGAWQVAVALHVWNNVATLALRFAKKQRRASTEATT